MWGHRAYVTTLISKNFNHYILLNKPLIEMLEYTAPYA